MSTTVPTQHPAVVLRSHYMHVRALLAIAAIAIVGLTIAVVALATAGSPTPTIASTASSISAPPRPASTRYDGGPDEGTRGQAVLRSATTRYDGGPDEGTRGAAHSTPEKRGTALSEGGRSAPNPAPQRMTASASITGSAPLAYCCET
jgi:hypothetical protein